jgi:hypothetical protein
MTPGHAAVALSNTSTAKHAVQSMHIPHSSTCYIHHTYTDQGYPSRGKLFSSCCAAAGVNLCGGLPGPPPNAVNWFGATCTPNASPGSTCTATCLQTATGAGYTLTCGVNGAWTQSGAGCTAGGGGKKEAHSRVALSCTAVLCAVVCVCVCVRACGWVRACGRAGGCARAGGRVGARVRARACACCFAAVLSAKQLGAQSAPRQLPSDSNKHTQSSSRCVS